MNSKVFVSRLSSSLGYTAKDGQEIVDSLVSDLTSILSSGDSVAIQNFGTFEVKKKMERIVVSPIKNKRILVPPKLTVAFKPSQSVKDKMK